jgi:pyruvate/2-oxoglutarate dehydrogenase complex dihydrolipoamide dehydrogenase (E3) component
MVGYLLARLMFRKPGRYRPPVRIRVAETAPALAEIGLGEAEARKRIGKIRIHRASFSEAGPGVGSPGTVKLICDSRDNLVGASILATDAVSLAGTLALAIGNNLGLAAIGQIAWPPGVAGEALRLAANAPQRARLRSPRLQAALRLMRKFG